MMENDLFHCLLSCDISRQVVGLIAQNMGLDESMATEKFFLSKTYARLESSGSHVWRFGAHAIFAMLKKEDKLGENIAGEVMIC